MGGRVSLALVIHNHQPVGNFGWVIEDVFEHAYEPMLGALERHPGVRLGLHYSGPLLQWIAANRPEAISRIRGLVSRGQVEVVGGAYYEPVLITLPDRDRQGQLVRMRQELEALFGRRPNGAWLAERVWEPGLAYDIATAGYGWTVLDDNHLRAASIPEDGMWTTFTTDDRGKRITVFGTEQGLRYLIPFKPVEDLMSYLRRRTTPDGRFVGTMGDDGEKFGSWPGTYEYCWGANGWVDRCFEAIESNAEWLTTVTPSEWLERQPPTTRAYFPTASYEEMTEWVLPPDETPVFTHLIESARERGDPAARFLRGGFWRNYAARYREVNELHKQMLRVSDKVAAMAVGPEVARAVDHLYQGQSNDCYWHGLFGGIYIVHMRMATLGHLIAAEDLADVAAVTAGAHPYGTRLADTDLDAIDEVLVTAPGQTVVVDLAEGAGISSWDLRAGRVALCSVMRRRPEAYHERLVAHEKAAQEEALGSGAGGAGAGGAGADAPRTIHDVVATKEPGLIALLHYDRHERRSGLIHLLPADGSTGAAEFVTATYEELGDFTESAYEPVTVEDGRLVAPPAGIGPLGRLRKPAHRREDLPVRRRSDEPDPRAGDRARESRRRSRRLRACGRVERQPAGWRPQPGGLVRDAGRDAQPARRPRRAGRGLHPGVRQRPRRRPGRRHGRARGAHDLVPGGDGLQLGKRLRARLPGQLAPLPLARGAGPRRAPDANGPLRGRPVDRLRGG